MIRRLQLHGRRSAVVAGTAGLAVVGLALVASAELGLSPSGSSDPTTSATSAAPAGGHGDDNAAVAVGKDGKSVWAIRLKVVKTNDPVVDAGNAAVAVGSCTDCETVAIAIEGVLVTGDVEVVQPVNVALSLNQDCTNCQTLAAAYQTVIGYGDAKVRLTGQGHRAINDLRKQLKDLRKSGLPLDQVAAEVDRIAGEFASVLRTQVVVVEKGHPDRSAEPSASSSSEPTPSATASPTGSATSSPAESPSPTSTPSS